MSLKRGTPRSRDTAAEFDRRALLTVPLLESTIQACAHGSG